MVLSADFDLAAVQAQIDAVRLSFDRYLDHYRPADTRSKHGLMGPVGKILRELKSGRRDPESLKGYAIRVHEATQQHPDQQAVSALEEAIDKVVDLLKNVPPAAVDIVVDRLDYGIYFSRRKGALERRETLNRQFREFLQSRYQTLRELGRAWAEDVPEWDRLYVFGPGSKTYRNASEVKKSDMAAFWDRLKAEAAAPAEVLLEEEE
jgi:hypothetical protein